MPDYDIIHVLTAPILIFSIYRLINTFFIGGVYSKKIQIVSYTLYWLMTSILIFFTRVPVVLMFFNLCSIFLITTNYTGTIQRKIIVTGFIYSILLATELAVTSIMGVYEFSSFDDSNFESSIGLVLVRTASMIFSYLISRYRVVSRKNFKIPIYYYVGILTILFGTLYLFIHSMSDDSISIYGIGFRIIVLLTVNIILIVLDERIYQSLIIFSQQKILEQQNEAFKSQAHISSEAISTIRALRHDIRDHLFTLNELFKNDKRMEFEEYISVIYGELSNRQLVDSDNFIFNSIINLKLQKLIGKNVDLKLDINIPKIVNILEYDVTVIVGNLLENAVSAVLESDERKMTVSITQSLDSIVIFVDNSYSGKIINNDGIFKTTKSDQKEHGYGLLNVEKSLEKYNGEIRFSYDEKNFSVAVVIPYL